MKENRPNKNYKSKNHSKFILTYHIIFVCKYRKKLLIKYGEDVKQMMYDISKRYDFEIEEMEVDKDHIHMMIESVPKISPLQIVRVLKQQSTIQMWRKYYKELKKYYWVENTLWTDGYFVSTIGEVSSKTLKHYIQNQG
jgi:putative transposase